MTSRFIIAQAEEIENAASSIRVLASIIDRHLVGSASVEGPLLSDYELGGISRAIGMIADHAQGAAETITSTLEETGQ